MKSVEFLTKLGVIYGYNKVKGDYGVEIEVEGSNLPSKLDKWWTTHNDGSLRGEAIEYVFDGPLPFDTSVEAIQYLEAAFAKNQSVCTPSPRTSVHVHVNMLERTPLEIYTLLTAYILLEKLLVAYSGDTRVGNNFCLRSSDADSVMFDLKEHLKSGGTVFNFINGELRYSSLNMAALNKFGTIEFRSFRGTTNANEIIDWLTVIDTFVTSTIAKYESPVQVVNDVMLELYSPLLSLVPMSLRQWIVQQPDWKQQIDSQLGYAIQVAVATNWNEIVEAKKNGHIKRSPKVPFDLETEEFNLPRVARPNEMPVFQTNRVVWQPRPTTTVTDAGDTVANNLIESWLRNVNGTVTAPIADAPPEEDDEEEEDEDVDLDFLDDDWDTERDDR